MTIPLTFLITDLHRGGSPLMLAALASGLNRRGPFAPQVVSIAPLGEVADTLRAAGIAVSSLHAAHRRDLRVVGRFVRHVRAHRPALVCSILIHANLLAAVCRPLVGPADGGRRVVWAQSLHTVQERPRWHWYAQGLISQMADAVFAPARAVLDKIERYGLVPRGIVIPNGIDLPRFRNAAALSRAECPWPADAWVVGYVGRFDPVKRLPLLLRAAKHVMESQDALARRLHVVLVGYGTEESALRDLARDLGLTGRVTFAGATREPERWYKTLQALCLPSPAEGFGLALLEGVAAGVPVIACETPTAREAFEAIQSAVLWTDATPSAEAIGTCMRKLFDGQQLTQASAQSLQLYSDDLMVERYGRAFKHLLDIDS